jgi:hypothetical protein
MPCFRTGDHKWETDKEEGEEEEKYKHNMR